MWKIEFMRRSKLPWACPECMGARLTIVDDSFQTGQTGASLESVRHEASEPEWVDGRFVCLLCCSNCSGLVALAGKYRVQDDRHYGPNGEEGDYEEYYTPLFFADAPDIIHLPPRTPSRVVDHLKRSFGLYWSDPEGCVNCIRTSVEALLTARRIPRTARKKSGAPRRFISLHERVELFRANDQPNGELLLAAKWIGNAGSHSRTVTHDDALDAYELVLLVLEQLYDDRRARVQAISRGVIRREGPRSRRRGMSNRADS